MGFARHQQHPQPITHAVDDNDRPIIVEGQLLRPGLDLDFDDVGSPMVDCDRQRDIPIDLYADLMRSTAILAPRDPRSARTRVPFFRRALGQVLDPDRQPQLLADEAKARRLADDEPAVAFVGSPGEESVERCADRFRCRDPVAGRDVVHLPVRDHDDASQALARDVRQRVIECLKEPGSIVPSPGLWLSRSDHAEVEIALLGEPIL
ncbi:MAG TPA: hypothetical protein VF942_08940, partial [Acidimicrobiales bacterium]